MGSMGIALLIFPRFHRRVPLVFVPNIPSLKRHEFYEADSQPLISAKFNQIDDLVIIDSPHHDCVDFDALGRHQPLLLSHLEHGLVRRVVSIREIALVEANLS